MENKLNIYQKLLKIQQKIHGLGKDKSALNYKYVTGDKVLGEIKPLMNDMGLLLKQEVVSIENTRQEYKVGKGNDVRDKSEINSKVMMRFTWVDCETGDKDENLFGANGQNDWDKGVGSALTYAERYFLLKYFHIATDEDDIDNPDRKPQEQPAKPQPKTEPKPNEKKLLLKWTDGTKSATTPNWKNTVEALMRTDKPITMETIKSVYSLTPDLEKELTEISNSISIA